MARKSYHGGTGVVAMARTRASTQADLAKKNLPAARSGFKPPADVSRDAGLSESLRTAPRAFIYSFIVTVLTSV
jgi:hypothetical protein